MDLRKLRYFVVAADEGNFNRAAQRLHLTQPSLSQQINELEQEVGVSLFDRIGRGVRLSRAGEIFLGETRALLEQLDGSVDRMRRMGRGESGRLRIAFNELCAQQRLVGEAMNAFRGQYPDIALEMQPLNRAAQQEALLKERIDAGFYHRIEETEDVLEQLVLSVDRYVLAIPSYSPLAQKERIAPGDLDGRSLIWALPARDSKRSDAATQYFSSLGVSLGRIVTTGSDLAAINFASVGMGIALVLSSHRFADTRGLVYKDLPGEPWTINAVLGWRRDNHAPELVRFVETVRQLITS
jgi:DNA-binding transcriptional LysR family regulator